ncbi:hypothetical protein RF11_07491 [Thelohanellus kitauei]|uniref:Uncharacterized protein n=1 Tax=Thelohanellus kitauei TaxID=669202 RepID=A0A0C2NJS5_THEKT|nr:hypothetical protein RF11_07491 [Thelohanellus kitauei]
MNQINCSDWFEKWYRDFESKDIFDLDRCELRSNDQFFDLDRFHGYLISQGITKENYYKMIISARCNFDRATQDFYRVQPTFESKNIFKIEKRDDLFQYLFDRQKATNSTKQSLIQYLNNSALYIEWTSNRFLSTILRCLLEGDFIDTVISMAHERSDLQPHNYHAPIDTPIATPKATKYTYNKPIYMLIISVVVFALFIVAMKLYKRGVVIRSILPF